MNYNEIGRGYSNLKQTEFEKSVVFFCQDKQVAHQIQTQNWRNENIGYEIFHRMEEVLDSFLSKIPALIVLIRSEAPSSIRSDVYNELFKQCKWLNIPIFFAINDTEQIGIEHQYDDVLLFPFAAQELSLRLQLYMEKKCAPIDFDNNVIRKELYDFDFLPFMYQLYMSTLTRLKKPFTLLFLSFSSKEGIEELDKDFVRRFFNLKMSEFILEHVRNSDFVFRMKQSDELVILFPYSGEVEVEHFLKRVEKNLRPVPFSLNGKHIEITPKISGNIVEIRDEHALFTEVINAEKASTGKTTIEDSNLSIQVVDTFNLPNTELVRVSIIETDSILANIIKNLLKNIEIESIELDIEIYSDGNHFFESERHLTAHTHLIIIDDILPKKDGLEVVHELRELPNTNKYIIFMLSTKKTDEDMTYAFQIGVDDYLIKPFNPKMFEARIKRYLSRFR